MPITSLPSPYGIGCFSIEAYRFIDFLAKAGQSCWQILPLGPTGYGDSPYQSFSTFAGNPYFIDFGDLIERGWLTTQDCDRYDFGKDHEKVDYEKIYRSRFKVLEVAYRNSRIGEQYNYQEFVRRNADWLEDYVLYMAIKDSLEGISWLEWEDQLRLREPGRLQSCREEFWQEMDFYRFQQFMFNEQWTRIKRYANEKGIKIVGDIPIYVALDSSDAWANPELFQFDDNSRPIAVAGCPPDGFSADGQLWGNPLYRWEYHSSTNYQWWIKRLAYSFKWYDIVRIDHFRGFESYYVIPFGDKTARNGHWVKGPDYPFFAAINRELGDREIIAEDLGFLTPEVYSMVQKTGYPGMKILQFAFDSREESDYLPHNYQHNCVVYTGTHDNDTTMNWFKMMADDDKKFCSDYLNLEKVRRKDLHWEFIRAALASVADLAVIPLPDYLGLGRSGRINTPSTLGGNWLWRLEPGVLTDELAERIRLMTQLYKR
jgi:4-alpha-glucanotransferase